VSVGTNREAVAGIAIVAHPDRRSDTLAHAHQVRGLEIGADTLPGHWRGDRLDLSAATELLYQSTPG